MAVTHSVEWHRHRLDAAVALGVLLLLHALAHGVGTTSNIQRISDDEPADLLGGAWHASNDVVLGMASATWAAAGLAMAVAGVMVLRHAGAARSVAVVASAASLVLCVVFLWAAVIGAVVDVLLLAALVLIPERIGLRPGRGSVPARP
ncbi:hypothetical protein [Nocardioides sp.]|uniref:hypothetical protein n=1 Tax=Nocardioides sp. TaxID=35761 RepID=UPI0025FCA935|nr:hypothetical protein [Nocardioides sp.]